VAHDVVEATPPVGVERDGKDQMAARAKDAGQLGKNAFVVFRMLDHVEGGDEVELAVAKRERRNFSRTGVRAAGVESFNDGWAEINKVGASDGESGPKTGADFESMSDVREEG